jgi:Glutamine amidotransferases class-II
MTSNPTQKFNSDEQVRTTAPLKQGLYDPQFEHDACGLGFVVNMKGGKSHQLVSDALQILVNLVARLAVNRTRAMARAFSFKCRMIFLSPRR